MTVSPMAFTPTDGLRNAATYPTTPANEAAARSQFQDPSDQLRDFINGTLIPAVDAINPAAYTQTGGSTLTAQDLDNKRKDIEILYWMGAI